MSQDRLLPAQAHRAFAADADSGGQPGGVTPAAGVRGMDDGGAVHRLPGGYRSGGIHRHAALDARASGSVTGLRSAGVRRHADSAGEPAGDAVGGGRLYPAVGTGRPRPPLGGLTGSSVLLFRPGHRNSSRTDQFSAFSASRLKGRISSIRPSRSLVAHSGSEISTRPTATRSNS